MSAGKGDRPRNCFSEKFKANYNNIDWTKQVFLFDVDGTLTHARTKMESSHASRFLSWMSGKIVFLVTGSDLPKTKQQLPDSILRRVDGTFCSMANELYQKNKVIYRNKLELPNNIDTWLNDILISSKCPEEYKASMHFEMRSGMLNFSICGRTVTEKQRKKYTSWDQKRKNRLSVVNKFNELFNEQGYEARLGGEISIDIQELNSNKQQAIDWVAKNYKKCNMIYFGDRCYEGGNDYDACQAIDSLDIGVWYYVKDPDETMLLLDNY